jgi:hypothetical protein
MYRIPRSFAVSGCFCFVAHKVTVSDRQVGGVSVPTVNCGVCRGSQPTADAMSAWRWRDQKPLTFALDCFARGEDTERDSTKYSTR